MAEVGYRNLRQMIVKVGTYGGVATNASRQHCLYFKHFATLTNTALPVTLLSFNGSTNANAIELNWTTSSEQMNDRFEVEHSVNGTDFNVIGMVKGSGTTFTQKSYSFVHDHPEAGNHYYRLRQIDFNGEVHYPSRIIKVESSSAEGTFTVFPNPVHEALCFSVNNIAQGEYTLQLLNALGEVKLERHFTVDRTTYSQTVDVSTFKQGIYSAVLKTADACYTRKVVIK